MRNPMPKFRSALLALTPFVFLSLHATAQDEAAEQEAQAEHSPEESAAAPEPAVVAEPAATSDAQEPQAESGNATSAAAPIDFAEPEATVATEPLPEPSSVDTPTEAQTAATITVEPLQAPAAPSVNVEESGGTVQLEEIVVTSTKRAKSVREIPATIVGFSGEDLERNNIKGIEDLARLVPGVNVSQPSEGTPRITIRGIAAQATTNATTGILYGDIPFTDTYLPRVVPDPLPFDLQTVEVLKGPQGTLFGAGSLNGAIRYVPEPAKLGMWETKYMAEYTQVHEGGAAPVYGAVINLPIYGEDTAALRLTGFIREAPGYVDNTQLGADGNTLEQQGLRASLVVQPSERVNGTLTYASQDSEYADNAVADNADGDLKTDNRPRRSPSKLGYQFADLKIAATFDWAQLISDTGYVSKFGDSFFDASSRLPGNGQTATRVSQEDSARSKTWSQELRLVSPDDMDARWQWVAGVAAFKQDVLLHLELPVGVATPLGLAGVTAALGPLADQLPGLAELVDRDGEALLAQLETNAHIREFALFGDVTRRLGDNWELNLGGRLYRTTSAGTARQSGLLLLAVNQEPVHIIEGTLQEEGFNPKASILWNAGRDLIAFAAVSKGFRVGGVQPGYALTGPRPPDFFKSDTLWNYEAGLRTQWLDRALRFDVTGFYITWDNPQTFQLGSSGVSSYIDNAGGVKNHGVEAALQTVLPFGFLFNTSACWTDTRTSKPFTTEGGEVAAGAHWPFAPHWQTATSLTWMLPVASWNLTTSANYSTISGAPSTLNPAAALTVFDYDQLDLLIAAANPSIPWMPEFGVTLNNVLDERGISNHFEGGLVPGTGYADVTYIRPRALTLRISGRF